MPECITKIKQQRRYTYNVTLRRFCVTIVAVEKKSEIRIFLSVGLYVCGCECGCVGVSVGVWVCVCGCVCVRMCVWVWAFVWV
jgi:hypothetical protein